MFSLVSGVYNAYWAPQQLNLLVVGAKGVGKTALLERLKVTQFDRSSASKAPPTEGQPLPADILHGAHVQKKKTKSPKIVENTPLQPPVRRGNWMCPAPARYQNAAGSDDEDNIVVEEEPAPPEPNSLADRHSSMESVEFKSTEDVTSEKEEVSFPTDPPATEYDLKPKSKMLPLSKVRPTIGMNLGKFDACGAKIRVWDLGGRLQDLWQRYYEDCDAVVFVWKLHVDPEEETRPADDQDDDDDRPARVTLEQQRQLLEQVRKSIPDDVPFLVLVHFWDDTHALADKQYTTAPYLMPNYHNPFQALFLANARTGQGVRSALQWLIHLAKKLHRIREKPAPSTSK